MTQTSSSHESTVDPIQPEVSTEIALDRKLGLSSSFSMITGSMLGIGIFLAPCLAARHIDTSGLFFGAWILTGIIALAGAWIYGRLGVMHPKSGGDYIFHREAFGSILASAYGWGMLSSAFAGSLAAMSVALCNYQLLPLLGLSTDVLFEYQVIGLTLSITGAQLAGIVIILLISYLNTFGLELSARIQEFIAFLPLFVLFVMCIYLFTLTPVQSSKISVIDSTWSFNGISNAFLEIYFAYSGWNAVIYVAGEVKDPQRTLPIALVGGTITVMCLYLFLCAAALHYVGLSGLRAFYESHTDLGSGIATHLGGGWISYAMTLLVTIALLASINATMIGGGRLAFMMAKDGCFWKKASLLSPKYRTPNQALWILSLMAILMVLFIPYGLIFQLISLVMVLGGVLTAFAYYTLKLNKVRQGEATFSPIDWLLPPLFIIFSVGVIFIKFSELFRQEGSSLAPLVGLMIVALTYLILKVKSVLPAKA